jgi:hypothetical protein
VRSVRFGSSARVGVQADMCFPSPPGLRGRVTGSHSGWGPVVAVVTV